MSDDICGWYFVNQEWNLYIDGALTKVHVSWIHCDEAPDGDEFIVKHFGRRDDLIKTLKLPEEDIEPVLRHHEKSERPNHL